MVIIHPFHCISEDARHCSALSYRQVADRDYRVPEVIDRHSFSLRTVKYIITTVKYPIRDSKKDALGSVVPVYDVHDLG